MSMENQYCSLIGRAVKKECGLVFCRENEGRRERDRERGGDREREEDKRLRVEYSRPLMETLPENPPESKTILISFLPWTNNYALQHKCASTNK